MRWVVHVARKGVRGGVYRVLVGKPEAKGPFGRSRLTIIIVILLIGETRSKETI